MCDQQHARALRHYAAMNMISCCSSCDAACAISILNRIGMALRNRMSQINVHMHLIGAEDIDTSEYEYEEVAHAWGATGRLHKKHKERKTPQHKALTKRAKVMNGMGGHELGECSDFTDLSACSSSAASLFSPISRSSIGCSSGSIDHDSKYIAAKPKECFVLMRVVHRCPSLPMCFVSSMCHLPLITRGREGGGGALFKCLIRHFPTAYPSLRLKLSKTSLCVRSAAILWDHRRNK